MASFEFHPLREQDLEMLHGWLGRPHVAEWWGPAESVAELRADYMQPRDPADGTHAFIASLGQRPVGFIQSYVALGSGAGWWEEETDPGVRGIDQFLAEAADLGQGLGRAMIRAFVGGLFADPAVSLVQTDPSPGNARAIACYARAGFLPIGPIDTPDGPALLMHCTRHSLAAAR